MPSVVKFIIGKSKKGSFVEVSCESKKLFAYKDKPYFAKPDRFLTKVCFKKEVLDKYYANPELYSVEDAYIRGKGWGTRMDNNHSVYIMAYLGDLDYLPSDEQHHWRSYNVFVESCKMSNVAIARDFYCEFRGPDSPDLLFKEAFGLFNENFEKVHGWKLFLPLTSNDEHNLNSLTILSIGNQKQFDEGVLRLAKILVDSINVKQINKKCIFSSEEMKYGGIYKLEKFLLIKKISIVEELIKVLKLVQGLRSKGSAHRKGSEYAKVLKKAPGNSLQEKYSQILNKFISIFVSRN